jgi:broad specificity phosphatase PhoE
MQLFIVRHGECDAQVTGAHDPDSPLDARGRRQAALVGDALARHGVTAIVASPLVRALATAQIAASALRLPAVAVWPDLREQYTAHHRGHGTATLRRYCPLARFPGDITADGWDHGGDTPASAYARCRRAIGRVRDEYGDGARVALITHGGCANTLAHVLLDLPVGATSFFELANGALHHFRLVPAEERLRDAFYPPFAVEIHAVNLTDHLRSAE